MSEKLDIKYCFCLKSYIEANLFLGNNIYRSMIVSKFNFLHAIYKFLRKTTLKTSNQKGQIWRPFYFIALNQDCVEEKQKLQADIKKLMCVSSREKMLTDLCNKLNLLPVRFNEVNTYHFLAGCSGVQFKYQSRFPPFLYSSAIKHYRKH